MNITRELFRNSYDLINCDALTTSFTYTFEDLTNNIREYTCLLEEYHQKGIDRVAIIVQKDIKFDTICLIFALLRLNIVPVIINEKIGERVKGIIEKEDIKVAFYDTLFKPSYLKKCDLLIDEQNKYFVTARPYARVNNQFKISFLKWYLTYLSSKSKLDVVCKLYDKVDGEINEEVVMQDDITSYVKNFSDLNYCGRWETAITTLPLYNKQGFLSSTRILSNDMHLICLNDEEVRKNISKILKRRPLVITVDKNMLEYLIDCNEKYDLSFVKKAIAYDDSQASIIHLVLSKHGFIGEIPVLENKKGKVILKEE